MAKNPSQKKLNEISHKINLVNLLKRRILRAEKNGSSDLKNLKSELEIAKKEKDKLTSAK